MKPDHTSIEKYRLSEAKEEKLWNDAVFVFDSSALLDLYFLPKPARQKLYDEIFKALPNRLWMPNHVQYEYLKNRETVIEKPITKKYEPLKNEVIQVGQKALSKLLKQIGEIENNTSKDDKHPYIPQDKIQAYKAEISSLLEKAKTFETEVGTQIEKAESEIQDVKSSDDVLSALEVHFTTGEEYTFEKIIEITKEGEHRYKYRIPPGYGDLEKNEKKGTQIFGDLILWKQILDYSKEDKRDVVFITNDITKGDDWCYPAKRKERIDRPREELIKEISDHSNVDLWMYSLPQFLHEGNSRLKGTMKPETIDSLANFLSSQAQTKHGEHLIYSCNKCNRTHKFHEKEFDLQFEIEGTDQRSMGPENHYVDQYLIDCECGNHIDVKFEIWEYPMGIHNYDSVELDGGTLIETFPFSINFFDEPEEDYVSCDECQHESGYVDIHGKYPLENLWPAEHKNAKYLHARSGECNYCATLHIRCPKCNAVNAFNEIHKNETHECDGACGLTFRHYSSTDRGGVEESGLEIVDPSIEKPKK